MAPKTYDLIHVKVGNQFGFRLPSAFWVDHPHLKSASGQVQVVSEDTLIVKLSPQSAREEDASEDLLMAAFLDMLMDDAIAHPSKLIPYTQEMMDEEDELLARVTLDP
jgi:antitoxin PrlF